MNSLHLRQKVCLFLSVFLVLSVSSFAELPPWIIGPIEDEFTDYIYTRCVVQHQDEASNQSESPWEVNWGVRASNENKDDYSWGWEISGGGGGGNALAQLHWQHDIGYSDTVEYTISGTSSIPALGEGWCFGCPSAGVPNSNWNTKVHTFTYVLAKHENDTKYLNYSFYYNATTGTILSEGADAPVLTGWARRNPYPVRREMVCQTYSMTQDCCGCSKSYQNPYTENDKYTYYHPGNTTNMLILEQVKSHSPSDQDRLCFLWGHQEHDNECTDCSVRN